MIACEPRLSETVLRQLTGSTLFYPHSANDLVEPIMLFAPYVTTFWFADLAYFTRIGKSADNVAPVLRRHPEFHFEGYHTDGPVVATRGTRPDPDRPGKTIPWMDPCIRSEVYTHLPSNVRVTVNRRRGFSWSAFGKCITEPELGVFFYRRDSSEGSSTPWLTIQKWNRTKPSIRKKYRRQWYLLDVLDKLIDGGLIVTDGSRCEGKHNPYRFLRDGKDAAVRQLNATADPCAMHTDPFGRRFIPVGEIGEANGPTVAWQVHQE